MFDTLLNNTLLFYFIQLLWNLWEEIVPYSTFKSVFAVYTFVQEGKRLEISDNCPFAHVIAQCWTQEPEKRPTFNEVVPMLEDICK